MRVLIVDDYPIVVSACRATLESDPSLEVFEASDGKAGYSAFFPACPTSPHSATQAADQDHHIPQNDDPVLLPAAVKSVAEGGVYLHSGMRRQIAFLRTGVKSSKMSELSPRTRDPALDRGQSDGGRDRRSA
jgi:DNA-binding NarL/FixJ family response regulator